MMGDVRSVHLKASATLPTAFRSSEGSGAPSGSCRHDGRVFGGTGPGGRQAVRPELVLGSTSGPRHFLALEATTRLRALRRSRVRDAPRGPNDASPVRRPVLDLPATRPFRRPRHPPRAPHQWRRGLHDSVNPNRPRALRTEHVGPHPLLSSQARLVRVDVLMIIDRTCSGQGVGPTAVGA
jgi:hypothetical protein